MRDSSRAADRDDAGSDGSHDVEATDLREGPAARETDTTDGEDPGFVGDVRVDRKRALLAVLPFLAIGLLDLVLLLGWGLDPLWGFLILPPILFVSALAWIAFRAGFVGDQPDRNG